MDLTRLFVLSLLLVCAILSAALGNQTGRIKVVFTPTICKVTCIGSRCHNNCEKGNTTTIISENGHTTDTLTAPNFRVAGCQSQGMKHLGYSEVEPRTYLLQGNSATNLVTVQPNSRI
ncbi:hypothetical protein ILYODFUR_034476 [Ilyodon furcidens]|uniref:Uncharacterized protein n=1 Tax=Ilyodon furcidens TaxID=33524 RepID=A0ABV0SRJ4_9TELE